MKNHYVSPKLNKKLQKFIKGDSMLSGIEENRISKRDRKIIVKYFPITTVGEMYDCIKHGGIRS